MREEWYLKEIKWWKTNSHIASNPGNVIPVLVKIYSGLTFTFVFDDKSVRLVLVPHGAIRRGTSLHLDVDVDVRNIGALGGACQLVQPMSRRSLHKVVGAD